VRLVSLKTDSVIVLQVASSEYWNYLRALHRVYFLSL